MDAAKYQDNNPLRLPWKLKYASDERDTNALDVWDCTGYVKIHHGHWGGMDISRLIAVAPELLEVLKGVAALLAIMVPELEKNEPRWIGTIRAREDLTVIRAAIAKTVEVKP